MPTSATGGLESRRRLIFLARCPNKHADVGPVGPTTNDLVNLGKRSRPDVGSTSAGLRLDVGTCGHIRRPADVGPRLNRRWADIGPSLGPTSGRRRHVYWVVSKSRSQVKGHLGQGHEIFRVGVELINSRVLKFSSQSAAFYASYSRKT